MREYIRAQLSCGVDYYKGEKGDTPVKGVDYFTQEDINSIIEQIEAGEIDLTSYATKDYVDSAIAGIDTTTYSAGTGIDITNDTISVDTGTIATHTWVDEDIVTKVPAWAMQGTKPTYTATEVGALPANTSLFSGDYNDLTNKPTIPTVPTNVSSFTNDAGYATETYVNNAVASSGATTEVISIPSGVITGDLATKLQEINTAIHNNQSVPYTAYFKDKLVVAFLYNSGNTGMPYIIYTVNTQNGMYFAKGAYLSNSGYMEATVDIDGGTYADIKIPASSSLTGSQSTLKDNLQYIDTYYAKKSEIPAAYTLPTASTSTLGGVKVDGSTITISNGVISATSSGSNSYTAGDGISIDSNNVISAGANPLIYFMLQMTTAGNSMPLAVRLDNSSTWEQFVDNVKAGKVVYIASSTSYTFSESYKLTPALLGISTLYAMNLDQVSVPMMSSSVASYPATGTQVYYSTYYYFDGAFLWSWKDPENLGNFIKVRYKNYKNYALGKALADINTDISAKLTAPTAPSADGTYLLTTTVSSGTASTTWQSVVIGGSY